MSKPQIIKQLRHSPPPAADIDYAFAFGWGQVACPFKISPIGYVKYARADLGAGTDGGNLNSFHNAKRAIDCQMDRMLWNLGLYKPRLKSPQKFQLLGSVGATSPRLLHSLIQQRNLLEHEYSPVSRQDAEDALDIADLFVKATDRIAINRPEDCRFWSSKHRIGGWVEPIVLDYDSAGSDYSVSNREEQPNAIRYQIFKSKRLDDEDPQELYQEWRWESANSEADPSTAGLRNYAQPQTIQDRVMLEFGMTELEHGIILRDDAANYVALLPLVVLALKEENS